MIFVLKRHFRRLIILTVWHHPLRPYGNRQTVLVLLAE